MVTQVAFTCLPEEKERWKEQAEEQGISLSKWVSRRVRAGTKLWEADEFQLDLETKNTETTPIDSDGGNLEEVVLNNLSTDPERAQSISEIVDLVLEDQEDHIASILEELDEKGHVAYKPTKGGYIKNE